ncbi:hypothetical protein ACHHYP_20066 [Achlya hypogyna]|uniref:FYVE-type domain-containing protein n=1 Tax=Achlya hypogyna TaxID=1202772 RepID=A0A1V9Z8S3_ACHHY|nr:hypothetical protein ACHHYP_20066 [Achlya hypogyna]
MALPQPPHFNVAPLTPYERQTYTQLASRVCLDTISSALTVQAEPVVEVVASPVTKRKARLSQGIDQLAGDVDAVCAYTQVRATLEEVAAIFDVDSPKKLRAHASAVAPSLLDRHTLHIVAPRRNHNPFHSISINWAATSCPFGISNRDACFLECQDEFAFSDPDKPTRRRGFVRAMHSIELNGCPSFKESHNLVRSHIVRSGHVFLETIEPGILDCYYIVAVDLRGSVPRMLHSALLRRECSKVLRLEEALQLERVRNQLATHGLARIHAYGDKAQQRECARCCRRFHLVARRRHCELCAEVVCSRCCFQMPTTFHGVYDAHVLLCYFCFNGRVHVKPLPERLHNATTKWVTDSITAGFTTRQSSSVPTEAEPSPRRKVLSSIPQHISILSIVDTLDLQSSFGSYMDSGATAAAPALVKTIDLDAPRPTERGSVFV